MQKKIQKDDIEFKIFNEIWLLYQQYYYTEDTDQYWEDISRKTNEIVARYDNNELSIRLSLAIIDVLEKRAKEKNVK